MCVLRDVLLLLKKMQVSVPALTVMWEREELVGCCLMSSSENFCNLLPHKKSMIYVVVER